MRRRTFLAAAASSAAALARRAGAAAPAGDPVSPAEMARVHDEVRTPFKYGVVLAGEGGRPVDCPSLFRRGDAWFMAYVGYNDVGYETYLARSPDLLRWEPLGTILPFRREGWDAWQAGGGIALADPAWGGSSELPRHDGKAWMSYVGGARQGYETDPLSIGLAWSDEPTEARPWTRLAANPVLAPGGPGARPFEAATLYRSQIVHDRAEALGSPFVMFYNAKDGAGVERIGLATSRDLTSWSRHGDGPIVGEDSGISGDPQIARIGDLWVMFYYGAFWKPRAFDTFACSRDLATWTKWTGPHLVEPSRPWDAEYAHKPWLVKHDGVVYHFYCAVGDRGRVIALATSRDLRADGGRRPG